MSDLSACRSCGAPMRWARTESGRLIPLDPEPVDGGNLELRLGIAGNLELRLGIAFVVDPDQPSLEGGDRYVSHFVTCPDADSHRRRVIAGAR